jgi:hypothetical protein
MTYQEFIESVARAWASMDGKAEQFDAGKVGFVEDVNAGGHYMGYKEEAKELLKRAGVNSFTYKTFNKGE